MRSPMLRGITRRFHRLSPAQGHVAHALLTLSPVAAKVLLPRDAPRLACVKPAASVHPEPGSNSSLYILIILSLFLTLFPKETDARLKFEKCYTFPVLACTFSLSILSMSRKKSRSIQTGLQR